MSTKTDLTPEAHDLLDALAHGGLVLLDGAEIILERLPSTERQPVAMKVVTELCHHRLTLSQQIAPSAWGVSASPLGLMFAAASKGTS
jgi:hypothetical protein